MKIISWNVNGYRSIAGQNPSKKYNEVSKNNRLFQYIEKENPDIICLQETKAWQEQIDTDLLSPLGYHHHYTDCKIKKGYSGVVTFSKSKPINTANGFGLSKFDDEGRIIETDFGDFIVLNIYFPNGTSGDARVDYKLEFYDAFFEYTNQLKKKNKKILVCGDYNTAHHEIDLARPKENINNSGFMPKERVKIDWMVNNGWIDSFRQFNKEGGNYTWWSARGSAKRENVGWRIDYHFITENMLDILVNCYHQPEVEGSDHCPIILEIKS